MRKVMLNSTIWIFGSPVETAQLEYFRDVGQQIGAKAILVCVSPGQGSYMTEYWGVAMENLDAIFDYYRALGWECYIHLGLTNLETENYNPPIPYTEPVEYYNVNIYDVWTYINRFKDKIKGIAINLSGSFDVSTMQTWLIEKMTQIRHAGLEAAYYHGDGAAPSFEPDPTQNVDAKVISDAGGIVWAWLFENGVWKPARFDLARQWWHYNLGEPNYYPDTYEQVKKWWSSNKGYLSNSVEALVWSIYYDEDKPSEESLNGVAEVSDEFLKIPLTKLSTVPLIILLVVMLLAVVLIGRKK